MTVADEVAWGAARLEAAGVPSARTTASLLLAHALGVRRVTVIAYPERAVGEVERAAFRASIERRAAGEPFQYLTGVQEFYGLEFEVTPDVLIPRPETEAIVEIAERLWPEVSRSSNRVLDVGTGSGCIAVTLALRLPGARVAATDLSDRALAVARRNAARLGARVSFARMDLAEATAGPFALVVSNPPYVPDADVETLQVEVRDHEPRLALAGGSDGLAPYRRLFADARRLLAPGGRMICEFGIDQADALGEIARGAGLGVVEVVDDLQLIPRTIVLAVADPA